MTKLSLLSSFLFFLILLTISATANCSKNESITFNPGIVKAPLVVIVTDEVIQNICYKTGDYNTCQHILNQFKGKTLFPKPLANVMAQVKRHAKTTAKKIVRVYDGMKDQHRFFEMRDAYRKCLKDYTDAMNELTKAEKSMADAKIKPVREYALNALNKVRSCDQELAKQWHEASGLTHDNKKFYDLSSILMVICGTLKMSIRID
ncbi:hypothetical protein DH2020_001813 [Rehmannia glutinosa]|uniref:Pectinesterase inhibitor domain-containing protein n=1 Tax=Rehmannia glutinosa TaxID=99300 RepID=A0ABR0XS21_REHGL